MEVVRHTEQHEVRSNRTFMELKYLSESVKSKICQVLIVPLWNWNNLEEKSIESDGEF